MRDSELTSSYARAIYEAALNHWVRHLTQFRDNLRTDEPARATLNDEGVPFETRKALVDRMLPPDTADELRQLVHTLVGEGHLSLLDDIVVQLRRLVRYGPEVKVATVTSAVSLDEELRSRIEKRLMSRYGVNVDISWQVDPGLIGGIVVRVGDELIDYSVLTRLELLRRALKEQP